VTTNLELYFFAWFPMVVLALLVGLVRDHTWGKRLAPEAAGQVSLGVAALLLGAYIAALAIHFPFAGPGQALLVGGVWAGITLALDLILRRLAPLPRNAAAADDDLFEGPVRRRAPLGLLLLLWIAVAPWLVDHFVWRR
jgi:hypothetical protein